MSGWIGVDLDGTLAEYDGWKGPGHIGDPIAPMVERVHKWIRDGLEVRIFTARVWHDESEERRQQAIEARRAIRVWLTANGIPGVDITCVKDYGMIELWDDRAVQVVPNTGRRADGQGD